MKTDAAHGSLATLDLNFAHLTQVHLLYLKYLKY